MIVNPFNFETPASRWSFTDREEVIPKLLRPMRERGRRVLVYGRRRMGKTSLVDYVAMKSGINWLSVDLSKAADIDEVARKLLAQIPPSKEERLARTLRALGKYVHLGWSSAGFEVKARVPGSEALTLEQALDFINDRAQIEDLCTTIGFDEFQEIRTLIGPRGEWRLRGMIQKHQHTSYVFSGSKNRLLEWMTEPKAAFYKQLETIHIDAIDPGLLATWIDERAHRGGLIGFAHGKDIVAAASPCTGDVVRLAKAVFQLVAEKRKGDIVQLALDEVALGELNNEYTERWRKLSPPMRVSLRAIAAGLPPFAASTLQRYGIRTASTASYAVKALVENELLVYDQDRLIFDSPFFRRWIEANAAPK